MYGCHLNHEDNFHRAEKHPYGINSAVRFNPPAELGEGYEDGFIFDESCLLTVKQVKMKRACRAQDPGLGRLVFLFHLDGQRKVEVPNFGHYTLYVPTFVAYFQPEGMQKINAWEEGGSYTCVSVGFDVKQPQKAFQDGFVPLSENLKQLVTSGNFFWAAQPLCSEMQSVASQIVSPRIHRTLVSEYLALKSRELMYLAASALLWSEDYSLNGTNSSDKALAAKSYIDQHGLEPISVRDLCERVSISESNLSKKFKDQFGCTVSEYMIRGRMSKAVELLVSTDLPMKQIAFDVGYNHVSNFSIAFKKKYGLTPGEVRAQNEEC